MDRTVQVTEETGRRLAALVSSANPRIVRKPLPRTPREPAFAGLTFKANAGETIPAFGCMKVTGVEWDDDLHRLIVLVDKPDTTFARHYLVNGPHDVEDGKRGRAQEGLVRVLYNTGSTPAVGEGWGPVASQWYVGQWYPETLLVCGEHNDEETLLGQWHTIDRVLGESTEAITKSTSGDMDPYKGVMGSEATAGLTDITAYNKFGDIANDDWVAVEWYNGQPYYVQAECPA